MKIVVCVKITPDAGDIETRPDGSISLDKAEWTIGGLDLQAMEAAVQLAEASASQVVVLCAGPAQVGSSKLRKDLLSRGPDELVLVVDEALRGADTAATASVLAAAVQKIGGADLVLCGEGSADLYFQQVGLQLGERLDWPTLNAVTRIAVEGDGLVVERTLEDEVEVLEVPLPAALSVAAEVNQPRLPTMKMILLAGKKPVTQWSLADLGMTAPLEGSVQVLSTQAPPRRQRKKVVITGSADEAAASLVGYLGKEGIV